MNNYFILVILAVAGGIAVALQAQFMSLMDKNMGTSEGIFVTYFSGGLIISLFMLVMRGGNLHVWQSVPWYAFGSGVIGLLIVGSIGYTTTRLGLVATFTLILAAQFSASTLMDHFGLLGATIHPLTPSRILGIGVLSLGVWLIIR